MSPTKQVKSQGNSGKEPKHHQVTEWKKKPWKNPGSVRGQFSSGVCELEARFTVTVR